MFYNGKLIIWGWSVEWKIKYVVVWSDCKDYVRLMVKV